MRLLSSVTRTLTGTVALILLIGVMGCGPSQDSDPRIYPTFTPTPPPTATPTLTETPPTLEEQLPGPLHVCLDGREFLRSMCMTEDGLVVIEVDGGEAFVAYEECLAETLGPELLASAAGLGEPLTGDELDLLFATASGCYESG